MEIQLMKSNRLKYKPLVYIQLSYFSLTGALTTNFVAHC